MRAAGPALPVGHRGWLSLPALLISAAFVMVQPATTLGLEAEDLLLIYNKDNSESKRLAEYYAGARGVPDDRLCGLSLGDRGETVSRGRYDVLIRNPVREYLQSNQLSDQVRCLVTFYGLPIRINERHIPAEVMTKTPAWEKAIDEALMEFAKLVRQLEGRPDTAQTLPADPVDVAREDYPEWMRRYARARQQLLAEVAAQEADPEREIDAEKARLIAKSIQQAEGITGLLIAAQPREGQPSPIRIQNPEQVLASVKAAKEKTETIWDRGLADPQRDEARELIQKYYGLNGLIQSLQSDLKQIQSEETQASVDSELMLLWWEDYPLYRWVLNPLCWHHRLNPAAFAGWPESMLSNPVLMVSRIDGPTFEIAKDLIDTSSAAEKVGLSGTVYIDARGIPRADGHGEYDQYLRELARLLQKETQLTVRLDNRPDVFQPGSCPRAMLYCGWYSLRKYVDAFDFVPGAVGYHIASFEAVSIKRPNEQGWVRGLLDDGIAATIGPVAEPYLQSFPRPNEFFGLLLTGEYTLAECYAYTVPGTSWMHLLIGDPLYNPFQNTPYLRAEQVFPNLRNGQPPIE